MNSSAKTVNEYINSLPEERRGVIKSLRNLILENLPEGYEETMTWGMQTYEVPLSIFSDTYNKKPLMYAALASQKNHLAVYLTSLSTSESLLETFVKEYEATGKKLDVGKSCIRFKKLEDLPLYVIAKQIASTSPEAFIQLYKKARG